MRGRKPKLPDESSPNRIREWRMARGMTIDELAQRMQSNSQTVHRHETGNNEMTLARLERYAEVLGVKVEELLATAHRVPPGVRALVDIAEHLTYEDRDKLVRMGRVLAEPPAPYDAGTRKD